MLRGKHRKHGLVSLLNVVRTLYAHHLSLTVDAKDYRRPASRRRSHRRELCRMDSCGRKQGMNHPLRSNPVTCVLRVRTLGHCHVISISRREILPRAAPKDMFHRWQGKTGSRRKVSDIVRFSILACHSSDTSQLPQTGTWVVRSYG